jgi:hypothetical protein
MHLDKHAWQCKKCMKTKSKNGISWRKVQSGFFICISDWEKELYNWINFIVIKNILPVTCPITRDISRLKPVSAQTLQSHLLSLHPVVKEAIKNKLTLVFDGWPEGTHHFVAVAAAYLKAITSRGAICLAQHLMIRTNIKALMFSHFICFKI